MTGGERGPTSPDDESGPHDGRAHNAAGGPGPGATRAERGGHGIARSFAVTISTSAAMLVLNAFTGVVTARLLDPDGRGEAGAITSWAVMVALLGGLGFREAMIYYQARHPRKGPQILSTTALSVALLGTLGFVAAQLLLGAGFAAQTDETLRLARVFMLWIYAILAFESMNCLLAGRQRFVLLGLARVAQPAVFASGLAILWALDEVTVTSVLLVNAAGHVVVSLTSFAYLARDGLAGPSREVAREGMAHGLRLQGQSLGQMGNSRLDLMLMPAVVAAGDIGLYVVAVSAASMIVPLFGHLNTVVLPKVTSSGPEAGLPLVERTLRMVIAGSALLALGLGVFAPFLLRIVYGGQFVDGAGPMRILLPGIVMWSATAIVGSGLRAVNRPSAASMAQLAGLAVTVVGLVVTLGPLGIHGAALTSTLAYTTVCVTGLLFLRQEVYFSVRRSIDPRLLAPDLTWGLDRVRAKLGRG